MIHKKTLLIIAVSLVSGILISSAVFSYMSTTNPPQSGESIGLHDLVILEASHSDGKLFYSAVGHNDITNTASGLFADCATGNSPITGTSCSKMISNLFISNATSGLYASNICGEAKWFATATTCMFLQPPQSSFPTSALKYPEPTPSVKCFASVCTGWNSSTIFTGFTQPFAVGLAGVAFPQGNAANIFDFIELCTSAGSNTPAGCQQSQVTLNPGDSINVTIVFTVTGICPESIPLINC
ncbi:MAG: hypothetical protein ACYCQJ_06990 [Nitrososphaerales archaeon]